MKKHIILMLVITGVSITGFSQVENAPNWQLSYYGDVLFHPGFEIGYQTPIRTWTKVKAKKSKEITKYKSFNVGVDFAYYMHRGHHHGLIFSPNATYQRTKQNGRYFQAKFSFGYHRSFVDGVTYTVDNEEVTSKGLVGQNTLYNAIVFDFGKDLRAKNGKPLRWFFQIGINGRYPYNKSYLPGIHTGLGIHYFFKK